MKGKYSRGGSGTMLLLLLVVVVSVVVVLFNGADMRVPDFLQDHSLSRRLVLHRSAHSTAQHSQMHTLSQTQK
eukprot:COSAG06_NODE_2865_length_6157_cov_30.730769_2_plen_73_part_00